LLVPPDEAGQQLAIRYVIFKAEGPGAEPDPVVYINGGPGEPVGIDVNNVARWWDVTRAAPWMRNRDVIVYDQRGVGVSTPNLACGELSQIGGRVFTERLGLTDAEALWQDAASRCRQRLIASGLRLEAFNTEAAVADLGMLLDRLGYSSWNLYGVSYGTRVALDFLRTADPARTRSVIVDSVYPPDVDAYVESGANADRAFRTLAAHCLADAACNAGSPHLLESLQQILQHAATDGYQVPVTQPDGTQVMASIDDAKLIEILFYGFYRWSDVKLIPAAITALAAGNVQPLVPLTQSAYETAASPESGYGAFLSSECHDEYPFNPADALQQQVASLPAYRGFMLSDLPLMACPSWPVGQIGAGFRQPVHSDVPVLLLAGDVDPITPPGWAKHAAETLAHGVVFVFPGVGHGVVASHACADRLVTKFLAVPAEKPFDECLLGLG
jgi:pimeloyl-ACP methyl ester carboxylesterase